MATTAAATAMAAHPTTEKGLESTTTLSTNFEKPLPNPIPKESHATSPESPHYYHWDPSPPPEGPRNIHPHKMPRRKPVPPPLDPAKHPYLYRPKSLWRRMDKRARILAIGITALCLLALIIGLAVGITHSKKSQNLPLPSSNGGPFAGQLTYYEPGLGACGVTSKNGDKIVAVSHLLYDAVQSGGDPNSNSLCGKMIRARLPGGSKSVDLKVVDRCTGCKARDLDITVDVFASLTNVDLGRVSVEWNWLESVPGGA